MKKNWELPRRTFLRGVGTAMALPALDAMQPALAAAGGAPRRMAFIYVPNGAIMEDWTPRDDGRGYALSPTLKALAPLRDHFQVISGLAHDKAEANGDGAGDHARAGATFLTGRQARKTSGADIRIGVSVDQVAAQRIGERTRLASLELSCDQIRRSGNCDSGYSCAYQFNLSWRNESTPMTPEVDPRLVFERLFSDGLGDPVARRRRQSVLDFALEDAKRLDKRLGRDDRAKLAEYLHAVRDLEQRIERAENVATALPGAKAPEGKPKDYEEYMRVMFDLMLLAFKTDSTRIATFLLAHDGSNRSFPGIGVSNGHHELSHHRNDERKVDKLKKIDRFYIEQLAYFLRRLRETPDSQGANLLDQSMIVYGSGISDANRHDHDNLPVILAGRGGGSLEPGRHLAFERRDKIPMTNLYLSLLDRMDVRVDSFGDSTGHLEDIS